MSEKNGILHDTRNVNKSCDILSINYKYPITLEEKITDTDGTTKKEKYTWNSPAAYIYASLLNFKENKISLNNYEPDSLFDVHKQLVEKETIYITENILNKAISQKLEQDQQFKDYLINTGETKIVYKSNNNLLGIGSNNDGQNLLGKCYMRQREIIMKETQASEKIELNKKAKIIMFKIYTYYITSQKLLLTEYIDLLKNKNFQNISDLSDFIDVIISSIDENYPEIANIITQNMESSIIIDDKSLDEVYNNFINSSLSSGLITAINTIELENLNGDNLEFNKSEIISIMLNEHIAQYVNNINTLKNKAIIDEYIKFIIAEKFQTAGPEGTKLSKDVVNKLNEDIAREQSLIFNEDGDICSKKIPQRIIELYKNYNKDSSKLFKSSGNSDSFEKFIKGEDGIEKIMTRVQKYEVPNNIIETIAELTNNADNISIFDKISEFLHHDDQSNDDIFTIQTNNILAPTTRPANQYFNIDGFMFPDITSYYFVEMLKFINNSSKISDYYNLIKGETVSSYKSTIELSNLFDKNYQEITEEKLAKAVVRILNVKFTACSISCAALDALIKLPKGVNITWTSSNTILGVNDKKEGKNLVGKYLTQIKTTIEQRKKIAFSSKSQPGTKIKETLSDESTQKLFIDCVNKFNYQLELYNKFKEIFITEEEDFPHDTTCCKKFMMLLFWNCDILHLIANNHINFSKIQREIIKITKKSVINTDNESLVQWFWGLYIIIATNMTDTIISGILDKDKQSSPVDNFVKNSDEYIKNFVLTIISVIYYFINVYINASDMYVVFSYSRTIDFINYMLFENQPEDKNVDISIEESYLSTFYTQCADSTGITPTAKDKELFRLLFSKITDKKDTPKIGNIIVYFNNPQFIFNRNTNRPISA
jgi:predicted NAD-dependent protein-ADP-ribosyltransferase YbiA (DUF1768 family)